MEWFSTLFAGSEEREYEPINPKKYIEMFENHDDKIIRASAKSIKLICEEIANINIDVMYEIYDLVGCINGYCMYTDKDASPLYFFKCVSCYNGADFNQKMKSEEEVNQLTCIVDIPLQGGPVVLCTQCTECYDKAAPKRQVTYIKTLQKKARKERVEAMYDM